MPKRTDIRSILIIGAGPIVIGQACEFDYSGAPRPQGAARGRLSGHLVSSNPATIMTDPGWPTRPISNRSRPRWWKIIEKKGTARRAAARPWAGRPASTPLAALDDAGVLAKFGVELIGAKRRGDREAEDRQLFREAMERIGLDVPRSAPSPDAHRGDGRDRACRPARDHPPAFTLGGTGGGVAYNREEFERIVEDGLDASPVGEMLIEESCSAGRSSRWRSSATGRGQLHHRLLDRERRSDGRPHRRFHHRRAGADADRQGIPDHAQRLDRGAARDRRRDRRLQRPVRVNPATGRLVVIEMNPRVSRSSALASKATGFPIAKIAAKLAVGYTLDELDNDITR